MQVKIVRLNPQLNLSGHTEARNPIKEPGKKQGKEMHGTKHPGKQQRRCRKKKDKNRAKKQNIEHRIDLLSWYHTLSCGFAVMHSATLNMDAPCHTSDAVSCANHGCLSTSRSLRSVCSQGWTIEGTNEGKSVNRLAKIWQAHRMQMRTAPSFPTAAL
jgi:hypothetical protein